MLHKKRSKRTVPLLPEGVPDLVRVKICGIKSWEDAVAALEAGAHALGFVLAESPRRIDAEAAREIILRLPPFVARVGVFVDEPRYSVQELATFLRLDALQFHGRETPGLLRGYSQQVIKAFRLQGEETLEEMEKYDGIADACLVDAYHPDKAGGTGLTADWDIARRANLSGRCLILAGGLSPENVGEAIRAVRPYAVDVSSGVEKNGCKDPQLIANFLQAVRRSEDDLA